ncbi:hypothetical protein GIB67_036471 [Kingdonia uniflora]|uniref:EF-hand domain-containing protein n=1 Tax=Kingdonia uniflora TaxID=39325 RepID=A0A7J7P7R5_9MAGN|nr:hypothetical protein GIB67_036471 [Kingdonia uniflora]
MVEKSCFDSETDESSEKSSSDEHENCKIGGAVKVSEYEKQRLERIRENRERLEALGLRNLSFSLMGSGKKQANPKGKAKKNEDDEYVPTEGEERASASSEDDGDSDGKEDEEDEFEVGNDGSSSSRGRKVEKGKNIRNTKKMKKKLSVQNSMNEPDFIDDDAAIEQAIALSLGKSSALSGSIHGGAPQNSRKDVANVNPREKKGRDRTQTNNEGKKRRKQNISRVGMTEDQVIFHFFNFDEAGKGNITLKDLQRVANTHDFPWTDTEMTDMIYCFDCDGDGKLNLDDFRKIVDRCNMVQTSDNALKP